MLPLVWGFSHLSLHKSATGFITIRSPHHLYAVKWHQLLVPSSKKNYLEVPKDFRGIGFEVLALKAFVVD